jgi:hypothetical protein
MNVGDLTNAYMNLRFEREKLSSEYKKADQVLESEQALIEQKLLEICAEQNANSISTDFGTVMRNIKSRAHVLDWDSFYEYIIEQKAPQLLQKRVHESNFNEFISEREDEGLPPGVNVMREYTITVRKPSARASAKLSEEAV